MITYLEGKLTQKTPAQAVVDIGGVGYEINISLYTYEKIASLSSCKLLTVLIVREDAHILYGFFDEDERGLFKHLIAISGIGPNTARMILSSLNPSEFRNAIIKADLALIKSIKGVGPKSAQRLIVELQDILSKEPSSGGLLPISGKNSIIEEALSAMSVLGFSRQVAERTLLKIYQETGSNITVEELIKKALKSI